MTITYTVKELAKILEPGQLGMQSPQSMLLFRPYDENDPRVDALLETSAWSKIKDTESLKAFPTLESYYALEESGLEFKPTQKVLHWNFHAADFPTSFSEAIDWDSHDTLFDYQREAARFLTIHDHAMLSLSPGLGKTLVSAYSAGLREFKNVLVVCPASLLYYWKGELEKWTDKLPISPTIQIWHRKLDDLTYPTTAGDGKQIWIITNPETVLRHLEGFISQTFGCLIVDESIMYKHRDSQRSQAMKDLAQGIDTVWFLTGAPATRYLDDMWHQFHILKPKGYSSYWRFARKYCIVEDTDWGSSVVANQPEAEKEIKKNFADIYFARTQDDVLNIPDWIMEDLDIPMLPKQDKAYETLRKELYIRLESIDPNEIISVKNHLSLMIRSIQVASNPFLLGGVNEAGKWNALSELMEIYPGPFIIWVNFIKTGELIRDNLSLQKKTWPTRDGKLRVALARGATKVKDRNSMVDSFQRGEIDALILNSQVGKFGFTLTRARSAFYVERMYDDSYFQCLHRNRRIGTTVSPIIVNMRSVTQDGRKTIDHLIHSTLDYRVGMIKKVTAKELKEVFAK